MGCGWTYRVPHSPGRVVAGDPVHPCILFSALSWPDILGNSRAGKRSLGSLVSQPWPCWLHVDDVVDIHSYNGCVWLQYHRATNKAFLLYSDFHSYHTSSSMELKKTEYTIVSLCQNLRHASIDNDTATKFSGGETSDHLFSTQHVFLTEVLQHVTGSFGDFLETFAHKVLCNPHKKFLGPG